MDLPNLFNKIRSHQTEIQYFLAVEITPKSIQTAAWFIKNDQAQIAHIGAPQNWEPDQAGINLAINTSLDPIRSHLEILPDQVIFGLPETWVNDTDISSSKKKTLKHICTDLGLKPVGFVVSTEAIINYLKETEGGPPSAILIKVSPTEVVVSLVYLGNLEGMQVVGRSDSLAADVEEGLARFPQKDSIPSRMIIYDWQEDLDEAKQELISYDWQTKLPFLHFPKIESLPRDIGITAIVIAGGSAVARSLGLMDRTLSVPDKVDPPPDSVASFSPSPSPPKTPKPPSPGPKTSQHDPNLAQEFGFTTIEVTAAAGTTSNSKQSQADSKPSQISSASQSGPKTHPKPSSPPLTPELVQVDAQALDPAKTSPARSTPSFSSLNPARFLKTLLSRLKKPVTKTPRIGRFKALSRIPAILPIGLLTLLLLFVGAGIAYWHLPSATVTILLRPEELTKELTFILDPQISEPDLAGNLVPTVQTTVSVSGNDQIPTTGSKTVGERAQGKIAIFNRTTSPKTFASGTRVSANDLAYTLAEEVTIASASAVENPDFSVTIQPSKIEVAITAIDIGTTYNLPTDAQFTIANFDTENFIAKAVTAIDGGTPREAKVISATDIETLESKLVEQLQQQITQDIKQASDGPDKGVVYDEDYTIVSQEYSGAVGDEAGQVNLSLSLTQNAYVYNIKDISFLAQNQMRDNLPQNYLLQAQDTQIEILDHTRTADDVISITTKTTLRLLPQIDTAAIAQQIKGQHPLNTQEYLRSIPGFVRTQTQFEPPLPGRLATFPHRAENIKIEVKSSQG